MIPIQEYIELPLLKVLAENSSGISVSEAVTGVEPFFPELTEEDKGLKTATGFPVWKNRVCWCRQSLVQRGELKKNSPRGIWQIEDAGLTRLANEWEDWEPRYSTNSDDYAQESDSRPHWFMGASWGKKTSDQTDRFVDEGVWENGYKDKYLELVKSVQVGERIAIKAAYTRKHNVPFDSRGHTVSVMAIKATGTVRENPGNGRLLKVDWDPLAEPREWYFYTGQATVWRVTPGDWKSDALINFAFHGKVQDLDRFRNAPYWRERFGDAQVNSKDLAWIRFFEELADRLLEFRDQRDALRELIRALALKNQLSYLDDRDESGERIPLDEVCPFTVMGIINRQMKVANRIALAEQLKASLNISEPVPPHFDGVPLINNQNSCFYSFKPERKAGDVDALWEVFAQAISYAQNEESDAKEQFIKAYDEAVSVKQVAWNLTVGLFWVRPWEFPTLDSRSREYIEERIKLSVGKTPLTGTKYLELKEDLETRFLEEEFSVHSFPELSLTAWKFEDTPLEEQADEELDTPPALVEKAPIESYTVETILADGCFLTEQQLSETLANLRRRKNLILQGPPGVGKTWLARRLGYALMGQKDIRRVRSVQFHPNLSYEDFIRGWRPSGDGKLTLSDGPFLEAVKQALLKPNLPYIVVVEEINRGNPASIFGEMLTLLEPDKRTPDEALELCYRKAEGERVYVPSNLYLIGTMNIADRSLALVDLALRRRFAFVDLFPILNERWFDWVHSNRGIPKKLLLAIQERMLSINQQIANDASLGPQFQIGHSYVTPGTDYGDDPVIWYRQVVETQIGPLLDEYWFDDAKKAQQAKENLLSGL